MQYVRKLYSAMRRRLFRLGPPYAQLRAEIAELQSRCDALAARQNATQSYYEHRVDLIYRRVTNALGQILEGHKIVAETTEAAEARYRRIFSSDKGELLIPEGLNIDDLVTGELRRGKILSPMTLQGFQLHPRISVEEGDAVRIDAGEAAVGLEGPFLRLAPGKYRVSLEISTVTLVTDISGDEGIVGLEVISRARSQALAVREFAMFRDLKSLDLEFEWSADDSSGPFALRVRQNSRRAIRVRSMSLV